jgi:Ran GTPase-activating protein (RanGAP) involved in mRNA processing and transport
MIHHINDLQLTGVQGSALKLHYKNILETCLEENSDLRKLKLSKTNLNDDKIVELLCKIIESDRNLVSVDFSSGCFSSKNLH